jgi:hypothetical protein
MFRVHRSTWIVVTLLAAGLIFWNIPGNLRRSPPDESLEHGWPWTYLRREAVMQSPISPQKGSGYTFNRISPWSLWEKVESFEPLWLAADVVVIAALCVAAGAMFEWRRRKGLWQWRITDLLFATLVIAGALGYGVALRRGHDADERLLSTIRGSERSINGQFQYVGPTWLTRSEPPDDFLEYSRCVQVYIDASQRYDKLANFPKLRGVWICRGRTTNARLHVLAEIRRLEHLGFQGTWLTDDESSIELPLLPHLQSLHVEQSQFDDESMKGVERMSKLRRVKLSGTKVSDEGLRHLVNLTHLRRLTIREPDVSDASLPILKGFSRLKQLDIQGTRITPQGIAELKLALPNCEIEGPEHRS